MPNPVLWRRLLLLIPALLLASGAAAPQLFEKTDPQHEIELGRQVAREVERQEPLSTDKTVQQRVQRIGSALVEALDPKVYPYEFKVLAKPDVNAFALPGGFIYIYEGLLSRVPDDDALAFVMAHEMAHAAHRHWAKHTGKMRGVGVLGSLVSILAKDTSGMIGSLAAGLMSLKYSRSEEDDADATGIEGGDSGHAVDRRDRGGQGRSQVSSQPPAGEGPFEETASYR